MTQLDIPTEVAAIKTWLESNGYEIGLLCIEQDPYKIGAMREQDGHEFELNIECNYYQGIIFVMVCTGCDLCCIDSLCPGYFRNSYKRFGFIDYVCRYRVIFWLFSLR